MEDGTVGYGTLADAKNLTDAAILVEININPSSPMAGATAEIATFPVSQLSIAETPVGIVEARRER